MLAPGAISAARANGISPVSPRFPSQRITWPEPHRTMKQRPASPTVGVDDTFGANAVLGLTHRRVEPNGGCAVYHPGHPGNVADVDRDSTREPWLPRAVHSCAVVVDVVSALLASATGLSSTGTGSTGSTAAAVTTEDAIGA